MLVLLLLFFPSLSAQLTLAQCHEEATKHYPLVQHYDIISKTNTLTLENLATEAKPTITIHGQATYQSEVTAFPLELPSMTVPNVSKDQYKAYGELVQPLTGFGLISAGQRFATAQSEVQQKKLDVDLYQIKQSVDRLFFGIILLEKQLDQLEITRKDIQAGIDRLEVAVKNGIAIPSDITQMQAESLVLDQKEITILSSRSALIDVLEVFLGRQLDSDITLVEPTSHVNVLEILRPELHLIELQSQALQIESELIDLKNKPSVSAFLQAGLGRPALNFLDNDFSPYALGGLRLKWNLKGRYNQANEKELLRLQQQGLGVQKEVFLFNINMKIKEESEEIIKLKSLIETDKTIIRMRAEIKSTAETQLENGIITSSDYLTYVIAEDKARQNLALHQTQLLQMQYTLKTTTGN